MNHTELLGFAAGSFVAVSLLPQAIKSWKTKSTKDISLLWGGHQPGGPDTLDDLWCLYRFAITYSHERHYPHNGCLDFSIKVKIRLTKFAKLFSACKIFNMRLAMIGPNQVGFELGPVGEDVGHRIAVATRAIEMARLGEFDPTDSAPPSWLARLAELVEHGAESDGRPPPLTQLQQVALGSMIKDCRPLTREDLGLGLE